MTKKTLAKKLNQDTPTDVGINKLIIDEKTGKAIERIRREPGSDTTITLRKQPGERMYRCIRTSIEQYGSYYEIKRNASGVWESEPRIYFPTP